MDTVAFHPSLPTLATQGRSASTICLWELDVEVLLKGGPVEMFVPYTTARLALVGDSGVGKTGLGWRLAHGTFKEHSSTHGQQFWLLEELGEDRDDGTECEAVLWDFAGQPDYRVIHSLFLDNVDIALLVYDPTERNDPLRGPLYWINQFTKGKGGARKKILVGARIDRGSPTLTQTELQKFCSHHGIEGGYVGTSALKGSGLEELTKRLQDLIPWGELSTTITSGTFKYTKEYVLHLKESTTESALIVEPKTLRTQLSATYPDTSFEPEEVMTAVGHLENHGYVMIITGSDGKQNILLAPELLSNIASSIVLEARRNPKGLGALSENDLLAGKCEIPELTGLGNAEKDVLINATVALFLERNICFRASMSNNTFLVFPGLINEKKPIIDEVPIEDVVTYKVSGNIENVYAAQVVLLGYTNLMTHTNQWQNQAQFEMGNQEICGFRQIPNQEGVLELVLYFGTNTSQQTRMIFQGLFEKILIRPDLSAERFPAVFCSNCRELQPRSLVVDRVTAGKGFFFCSECGQRNHLPKSSETVSLSERDQLTVALERDRSVRRTIYEAALVRVKAILRDREDHLSWPSCFVSYSWRDTASSIRWVERLVNDLGNAEIATIFDQYDNQEIGSDIPRFINKISESNYIITIGTPTYLKKYNNKDPKMGHAVAAEMDLVNQRLTGSEAEKATILPILRNGSEKTSLPPLLVKKVYADFRKDEFYFLSLFKLLLTIHKVPFTHPGVIDLLTKLEPKQFG
ncbi:MAG: TIR domain-containing protein [Bacteroidetes bacterium]|nr:TIR domain-containing protein [Bacteroidota bacterium]